MIADVVGAVNKRLRDGFGYDVHNRSVKQGLAMPCFFVSVQGITRTPFLYKKGQCRIALDIAYIAEDPDDYELADKAWLLDFFLTELIFPDGKKKHAKSYETELVDDVLHVLVAYDVTFDAAEFAEYVEDLEIDESVKEGEDENDNSENGKDDEDDIRPGAGGLCEEIVVPFQEV